MITPKSDWQGFSSDFAVKFYLSILYLRGVIGKEEDTATQLSESRGVGVKNYSNKFGSDALKMLQIIDASERYWFSYIHTDKTPV
jgi:hypothetical protein